MKTTMLFVALFSTSLAFSQLSFNMALTPTNASRTSSQSLLVETEHFQNKGGWLVETQFVDQMGSPYLMAHGVGEVVDDAFTVAKFPEKGKYNVWVRTKDWAPYPKGPGKFQLLIDGKSLGEFGSTGLVGWQWYAAGTIMIENTESELRLKDLTGFDGRCDAIYFTKSRKERLPNDARGLERFRKEHLPLPAIPRDEGRFDFVVVGGGVAGMSAAIQAARLGLKVALINNRPVLGGTSSSEIRVPMDGDLFRNRHPGIGRIVREIDNHMAMENYNSPTGDTNVGLYRDDWRRKVVLNEKNISLFENMHINKVKMNGTKIDCVIGTNLKTLEEHIFSGTLFADCTGDANLGLLAGAHHRYGRESHSETNEEMAPAITDSLLMGSSNQWYAKPFDVKSEFPIQDWMLQFSDEYHFEQRRSYFNWETGFGNFHTVDDAEEIRDHNLRAIYGNWAFLKTKKTEKYENYKLVFLAHVSGKRESYRLLGDIVLTENDIEEKIEYPDAIVTTTWGIDLHYPDKRNSQYFPRQEFISYAIHPSKQKDIYTFPYRCLYSRNIENLFMAGRNISVTHVALGAVRVQRCTGMMGEVVGIASYLCYKNKCNPRDIYQKYLTDLMDFVKE